MPRVLHVYKTYYPETTGGGQQAICQIATTTKPFGCEHRVLTLVQDASAERFIARPEADVYRVPMDFDVASNHVALGAVAALKEHAPWADVVHYHFPWPYGDVMHFLARHGKPSVVTYHSDVVRQRLLNWLYKPLMWPFLWSVDAVVATSPNYAKSSPVLQKLRCKTEVIPFGLDPESYPAVERDRVDAWKKRLGDRYWLFVGQLRYYKGLHILIDAIHKNKMPLVIVGSGSYEGELRARVTHYGLQDLVHFLGQVSHEDKMALLDGAYGFVFPSHLRSEAFGLALLEAAMMGKPMVSCEIGTGTSYVNLHEKTGLVVPGGDAPALAEALERLWGNASEAARFGVAAQERFYAEFTPKKMGKSYTDLYQKVMV